MASTTGRATIPAIVPEPCTLEPTESYSKDDLDEYAAILAHVAAEAYTDPARVASAPHNSTIHAIDHQPVRRPGSLGSHLAGL